MVKLMRMDSINFITKAIWEDELRDKILELTGGNPA